MSGRLAALGVAISLAFAPPAAAPRDERADAIAAIAAARFDVARPLLEKLVAAAPADVEALCLLAFAQVSLGDPDPALATAARVAELAPTLAAPAYYRGRAQLLRHEWQAADAAFDETARLDPRFWPEWRAHFQALAALGVGDEARAHALYAQSPESQQPWADPAFLFERMGNLHAIAPDPADARRWYRRAADGWFTKERKLEPFVLPLPVRGAWWVAQGNFGDESHFGIAGSFGFDLLALRDGKLRPDGSTTRESSFTWDAPVEAPLAGEVAVAVDGIEDQRASAADLAPLAAVAVRTHPLGNHVVLKLAADRFLLLAHLRHGSVEVKVGQLVSAGAPIGRVGQTGVSYAPHLHLTLWSSLEPPIGHPLRFDGVELARADGSRAPRGPELPARGDVVERK